MLIFASFFLRIFGAPKKGLICRRFLVRNLAEMMVFEGIDSSWVFETIAAGCVCVRECRPRIGIFDLTSLVPNGQPKSAEWQIRKLDSFRGEREKGGSDKNVIYFCLFCPVKCGMSSHFPCFPAFMLSLFTSTLTRVLNNTRISSILSSFLSHNLEMKTVSRAGKQGKGQFEWGHHSDARGTNLVN